MKNKDLLKYALEALKNSYSPYSNYKVGAAILLKNGKIVISNAETKIDDADDDVSNLIAELEEKNEALEELMKDELEEKRTLGLMQGLEEGRIEGHMKGLEEGRMEGHMKGLEEGRIEGCIEGKEQATDLLNTLTLKLAKLGRTDDIIKAAADKTYQNKLLEEFGLL